MGDERRPVQYYLQQPAAIGVLLDRKLQARASIGASTPTRTGPPHSLISVSVSLFVFVHVRRLDF